MAYGRNCRHCGHPVIPATSGDRGNSAAPADDRRIWKHTGVAVHQTSMVDDQTITPWACKSAIDGRWHPASPVITIADLADAQPAPELLGITTPTDDRPENPWTNLGTIDDGQGFTFTPNPNDDWYSRVRKADARTLDSYRRAATRANAEQQAERKNNRARRIRFALVCALVCGLWISGWVGIYFLLP